MMIGTDFDDALDRNRMRLVLKNALDDLNGIKALLDWFRQRTKHDFDILWKSTFLSIEKITNKSMSIRSDKNRIYELERQLKITNEKHEKDLQLLNDFMVKISKVIGDNNQSNAGAQPQNIEIMLGEISERLGADFDRLKADNRKLTEEKHNLEIVAQMLNDENERLRNQNTNNESFHVNRDKLMENMETLTILPNLKFFEDRQKTEQKKVAKFEDSTWEINRNTNVTLRNAIWNDSDDVHEQLYEKTKMNLSLTNEIEMLNLKLTDLESDLRCAQLKCHNLTDQNRKLVTINEQFNDFVRDKDLLMDVKVREIECLQEKLTVKSMDCHSLENHWFDEKAAVETANNQVSELKKQFDTELEQLKSQMDRVIVEKNETNGILIEKLKAKDNELVVLSDKFRSNSETMQKEWQRDLESLRGRLEEQVAVKDTEIAEAEKTGRNLRLEMEQVRQKCRAVEYEKQMQQDELKTLITKLTDYEQEKLKWINDRSKIDRLNDERAQLQTELNEQQQNFELLTKKLECYEIDKMKLFEEFEKLLESLTESEKKNVEFQKRLDELKAEELLREKREQDLRTRLDEQINESEKMYESVQTCQIQVEKLEKAMASLGNEKHQLRQQLTEIEEFWQMRETHFYAQLETNAKKIKKLQNDRYNLEICLSDAKQQVEDYRMEIRAVQSRTKQQTETAAMARKESDRKLNCLLKQLQQVAHIRFDGDDFECTETKRKLHSFLNQVNELRSQQTELKKEMATLQLKLARSGKERIEIIREFDVYKDLLEQKEDSFSSITNQLESYQKELCDSRLKIANLEVEKFELAEQLKLRKIERDPKSDGFDDVLEHKNNEIANQKCRLNLLQKNNEFLQKQVESLQNSFENSLENNETNLRIVQKMKKNLQTDPNQLRTLFEPKYGREKLSKIDEEEF